MSFTITDNREEYFRRDRAAKVAGLIAGAQVIQNEIKRDLVGGYTSGDFTQGNVLNSVTKGDVFTDANGEMAIEVGTNVPYALYWELGHYNIFTRRYERVEIWATAAARVGAEAHSAFERVYQRFMEPA